MIQSLLSCRLRCCVLALVVLPIFGSQTPCSGQTTDAIEYPSDQLSESDYSRRQQATMEMWRRRDFSREQVQEAARHTDPEVSGRAKWILRQWRRGSLPDTPPEISRLLQRTDDPAVIEELLEAGQFGAAVVAVEESVGTIDREAIQKRVTAGLVRRFPIYIQSAIKHDSLPDLLKLIDLVADSKELAVCRVQMMRELGIEVDASSLLPTSSEGWSAAEIRQATVLVLVTLGKLQEATSQAELSGDQELLRVCRMLSGRWEEIATDSAQAARAAESGSSEATRLWCQAMTAADRCDRIAIFQEAAEYLADADTDTRDLASELRWKCLANHGEVERSLAILDKLSPDTSAVVAVAASRPEHAFKVLQYPLDRLDQDLDDWIDAAIKAQRSRDTRELAVDVRRVLALMRCLLSVGRDDAARRIADRLCRSDVNVGTIRLREYVLSTLTMTSQSDWVAELAVIPGDNSLSAETEKSLVRSLPDADQASLKILMESIETLMPRIPLADRVQIVCQLFEGEIPEGFDPQTDFKRLYDQLTIGKRQIERVGGRVVLSPQVRLNLTLVSLFARHGQADLASKCLRQLVNSGDVEAALQVAEGEQEGGSAQVALDHYDLVWEKIESQGRAVRRLRGGTDDVNLAAKALVGKWMIARRRGDLALSDQLSRQLRLTLCSPSTELRSSAASYLGEHGQIDLALEVYNTLLPMTAFGTQQPTGFYDVAREYSSLVREEDAAAAARWFDLAVGGTLESTYFRSVAYITLPLYVRRWALEAAIQNGDAAAAEKHLDRILKLDPLDIDFAERLLPKMRTVDMDGLANRTFDQILDRGIEYAQAFPFDATTCNNLAWVAAMNDRRLEEALKLSQQAVYAEPDSAIYRDTLAEVLFRLGRKQEALQVEQACLLDDPGQWHLHQQIKKYKEAIASETKSL